MQRFLKHLDAALLEHNKAAFFAFLRDPNVDPRKKFAFAPHVAHFALSFGDLCTLVLRQPATDEWQEIVNHHSREDEGHWRWFLSDLKLLGEDRTMPLSEAITFIWNDDTIPMRRLSYELCRYGLAGDSIRRLALVYCIEGAFHVMLENLLPAARALTELTGKTLSYMGQGHSDVETSHVLDEPEVRKKVLALTLEPRVLDELCAMADRSVQLFTGFTDNLLALAKASPAPRIAPAR